MKCEKCNEEIDKTAFWRGKMVCQRCWSKLKYSVKYKPATESNLKRWYQKSRNQ